MEKKKKKKEPRAAFFYALVKQCGLLVCVERVTCVEKKKKKMTLMKLGARRFCKGKKKKIMTKQQKKKRALRMQAQSTSTHSLCLLRFFSFFFLSFFLSFLIFVCVFVFQKNNTKAKVLQTHRLEAIIMYIVARERPSFTYTWCNTNSRLQSSFFFFFEAKIADNQLKKKKRESCVAFETRSLHPSLSRFIRRKTRRKQ